MILDDSLNNSITTFMQYSKSFNLDFNNYIIIFVFIIFIP